MTAGSGLLLFLLPKLFGQLLHQIVRGHHAVKHGGVQHIHNGVSQISAAVENRIQSRKAQPVAGAEDAEHCHAEGTDKFQIGSDVPQNADLPCVVDHGAQQQRDRQQGHHRRGHNGEQHSGEHVGDKQGFPAQGHGVQRIAHPGIEQIAKEQHSSKRSKEQVHQAHDLNALGHIGCKPEVDDPVVRFHVHQAKADQQAQQVNAPQRCKPGDVLAQKGLVIE